MTDEEGRYTTGLWNDGRRMVIPIPQPLIAPIDGRVTAEVVAEVWDCFVRPSQAEGAPPQSMEMRALMAILRAVYEGMMEPAVRAAHVGQRNSRG